MLSDVNELRFDSTAESQEILGSPSTTPEIVACCKDLKLLGRNDFKGLLKWRMSIIRERQFQKKQVGLRVYIV